VSASVLHGTSNETVPDRVSAAPTYKRLMGRLFERVRVTPGGTVCARRHAFLLRPSLAHRNEPEPGRSRYAGTPRGGSMASGDAIRPFVDGEDLRSRLRRIRPLRSCLRSADHPGSAARAARRPASATELSRSPARTRCGAGNLRQCGNLQRRRTPRPPQLHLDKERRADGFCDSIRALHTTAAPTDAHHAGATCAKR
jgi:hypothetical protein